MFLLLVLFLVLWMLYDLLIVIVINGYYPFRLVLLIIFPMMNDSFFPTQSGAPQMPQIFSKDALNHAGVQTFGFGKDFTDNYIAPFGR